MHSSSVNFTVASVLSALIAVASCIATITHHWSALKIPSDSVTPLTTATGGYDIQGSYHAGLFQFCMDSPSEGHYKTCYGITMPMNFTCEGPDGDIVRTASSLYLRLTLTRVAMIVSILIALSAAIVCFIGTFKRRKAVYLWSAMALTLTYTFALTSACVLYGYTEGYWYKCGHNQCGGMSRCLFSFGYSYGLAIACMILSFFVLSFLWSMRRGLPASPSKNNANSTKLVSENSDSILNIHPNELSKSAERLASPRPLATKSEDTGKPSHLSESKHIAKPAAQLNSSKVVPEKSNVVQPVLAEHKTKGNQLTKESSDFSDTDSDSSSDSN